jgi:hypothetical protein
MARRMCPTADDVGIAPPKAQWIARAKSMAKGGVKKARAYQCQPTRQSTEFLSQAIKPVAPPKNPMAMNAAILGPKPDAILRIALKTGTFGLL